MDESTDPTETVVELIPLPDQEMPPVPLEMAMAWLRSVRNGLLAESDWMVLPDVWETYSAEKKAALTTYRQALRDLPNTTENPHNPVWPIRPE